MNFLLENGKAVIGAAILLASILTGSYAKVINVENELHARLDAQSAAINRMTEAIKTQTAQEAAVAEQTAEFNKLWYDTGEIQTQGTYSRLDSLTQSIVSLQNTYTEGVRHVNFVMGKHQGQHMSCHGPDPEALRVRDRHPD